MTKTRNYNERYMKLCPAGKEIVDRAFVAAEQAERLYRREMRKLRANRVVIIDDNVQYADGKVL